MVSHPIIFEVSYLVIFKTGSISENPQMMNTSYNGIHRTSIEFPDDIHQIYQLTKINEEGMVRLLNKTLVWGEKDA